MDGPREDLDSVRAEVLKLRSVLLDRTTELPAYPLFVDDLRGILEKRRQVGVLHLEIVDLDVVESLYGWQVFDRILARASHVLRDAIGRALPAATLLAINGTGGDRFIAFFAETEAGEPVDVEDLEVRGRALQALLADAFAGDEFDGLSPPLRFRVGHALLSESPFYRFERRVHAAVEEARTLPARREGLRDSSREAELLRVIEEAAISTLFQPVVDLTTGTLFGFEALSRGPRDTLLELPSALFSVSSRFGLSQKLDRLCRRTALRGSRELPERGKLFVNLLPATLDDREGPGTEIASLLAQASLSPEDLVVELSERAADLDPEAFAHGCERIRREGFGLAIDDVGTGYATLGTLEAARPDYVKMDGSLVHGIHENLIKQELLSSLVEVGLRLGAAVIAEGVETADETAAVRALGARYGQGFYFARPAPASPPRPRPKPEA